MGVELVGDASVHADAEVISLVIEALLNTGLQNFQVSVGNARFFKGLCKELGFSTEMEYTLREYISNKNFFGAEEYLINEGVEKDIRNLLLKTNDLIGSVEVLEQAEAIVNNECSLAAVKRLRDLYEVLKVYGIEKYVSFDLGMLNKYQYYTGVIFKVYTYGVGDAIVKGGRYDGLLTQFGKTSPAVGFVILIDDLMQALSRQKISIAEVENRVILLYDKEAFHQALAKAKELRSQNKSVEMIEKASDLSVSDYEKYGAEQNNAEVIYVKE